MPGFAVFQVHSSKWPVVTECKISNWAFIHSTNKVLNWVKSVLRVFKWISILDHLHFLYLIKRAPWIFIHSKENSFSPVFKLLKLLSSILIRTEQNRFHIVLLYGPCPHSCLVISLSVISTLQVKPFRYVLILLASLSNLYEPTDCTWHTLDLILSFRVEVSALTISTITSVVSDLF